ncbi:unknown similar to AMEV216 [Mythimna separata entomopoxvirus 'L']|uniref:Uncharacterized protein n=1 Tax=Mythimna separata entomopoxvirus 'L' TaxID=1293572 RepID=A0A916NYR8_9POXV|nr:unknown similar to AMEV216 [Mythimna separata entomopoxvirus 'L']CCU56439.1 unknown similar to AMEV216 [Mythimna separata entomopoxvirus 'L']
MIKYALLIFSLRVINSQYVCNKQSPDLVLRLPDILDCEDAKTIKSNIILQTLNEKTYVTDAILFSGMALECIEYPAFHLYGNPEYKINYIRPSFNDIINANITKTFNNINLTYNENSDSYIYGKPNYKCISAVFYSNSEIQNYIKLTMSKVKYTKGVMLSNVANTYNCKYEEGYCLISNSDTLVWIVDKNATIDYVESEPINSNIIENNDNLHVLFNYLGNPIALVISKSEFLKNKNEFISTNEHEFKIRILNYDNNDVNSYYRYKRDIYDGKMQYISDLLYTDKAQIKELCEKVSLMILEIYSLCKVNPYSCISTLLNDKAISVEVIGNLYMVKKCLDVKIIKYKPAYNIQDNTCHELIPVIFEYFDTRDNGYYNVETEEIFFTSQFVKKGMCENENRFIACYNGEKGPCVYNNNLGSVKHINMPIQTLTKNNINKFATIVTPNITNKNFAYKPSISDVMNRPLSFMDLTEINHISNQKLIQNKSKEIILYICLYIIVIYILISTLIAVCKRCIKSLQINPNSSETTRMLPNV